MGSYTQFDLEASTSLTSEIPVVGQPFLTYPKPTIEARPPVPYTNPKSGTRIHYGKDIGYRLRSGHLDRSTEEDLSRQYEPDAFDPTKVRPDPNENLRWLCEHLADLQEDYAGKWVAVRDARVIVAASDLLGLMRELEKCGSEGTIVKEIPKGRIDHKGGYVYKGF